MRLTTLNLIKEIFSHGENEPKGLSEFFLNNNRTPTRKNFIAYLSPQD